MMDYRNNYNNENETNNENMMAAEQNSFNGKKPSSKNKKAAKLAKKIGAIALSAVLFGGVAGGTFQAVNHFTGSTTATATTTTAQQTTSNSSLLKAAATSSSSTSTGTMDVSTIAKNAMPSIVSITNQSVQEVQNYFSMFGYGAQTPQTEETTSCGSGIIIGKNDTELLIVTNNHVVEDADTLSVSFVNNQVCKANIKGTDADNDLAVIAVPLSEIPDDTMSSIAVATMGDSDSVEVGEQVVAIGNALGYGQSVTTGIISAGFVEQYQRKSSLSNIKEADIHEIAEIFVDKRFAGKSVEEMEEAEQVTIFLILRGDLSILPQKDTMLKLNDIIVIRGEHS